MQTRKTALGRFVESVCPRADRRSDAGLPHPRQAQAPAPAPADHGRRAVSEGALPPSEWARGGRAPSAPSELEAPPKSGSPIRVALWRMAGGGHNPVYSRQGAGHKRMLGSPTKGRGADRVQPAAAGRRRPSTLARRRPHTRQSSTPAGYQFKPLIEA